MAVDLDLQLACAPATPDLPSMEDLRTWVEAALKGRRDEVEITIRVVDEAESRALNRDYRAIDRATNVLSFPFTPPPMVPSNCLGDLVICAPLVVAQAREQGKTSQAHWAHLVVHGTLHLLGYDHISDDQAAEMEELEGQIVEELGFPPPYDVPQTGAVAADIFSESGGLRFQPPTNSRSQE